MEITVYETTPYIASSNLFTDQDVRDCLQSQTPRVGFDVRDETAVPCFVGFNIQLVASHLVNRSYTPNRTSDFLIRTSLLYLLAVRRGEVMLKTLNECQSITPNSLLQVGIIATIRFCEGRLPKGAGSSHLFLGLTPGHTFRVLRASCLVNEQESISDQWEEIPYWSFVNGK